MNATQTLNAMLNENSKRRVVKARKMAINYMLKAESLPDHRFIIGLALNALLSKDEVSIKEAIKACREYLKETKND